jgi:dTDP-4-dehydrorhamnose reductase
MRLLIIGATSFVGKYVLFEAINRGYDVLGTQKSTRYPMLLTFDLLNDTIADCVPKPFLNSDEEIYAIVCSAIANMSSCTSKEDLSLTTNVTHTIRLIDELHALRIKCLFLSTGAVYDGVKGNYQETDPTSPINEYGKQKVEVENYILSKYPESLIVRLSKAISDDPLEKHLFSEWFHHVTEKRPIRCVEYETFTPTSVSDIANAIIDSIKHNLSGIFHVAGSEAFTRGQLASLFLKTLKSDLPMTVEPIQNFSFPEKRPQDTHLDCTKFINRTNFIFTPIDRLIESFCYNLSFKNL